MTIEILRSIERILGVIIAGICIYLGFRLFLALPKKNDSTGKLVLPGGLNVYLSRIGPGAFFALFGCALVVMSFKQAITVQRTRSIDEGTRREIVSETSYHGIANISNLSKEEQSQRLAKTRRTLMDLNRLGYPLLTNLQADERLVLRDALERSQLALLSSVWTTNWGSFEVFESWVREGQAAPLPDARAAEARDLFNQARPAPTP
jgi:hypothetical protein